MAADYLIEAVQETTGNIMAAADFGDYFPLLVGDDSVLVQFYDAIVEFKADDIDEEEKSVADPMDTIITTTVKIDDTDREMAVVALDETSLSETISNHLGSLVAAAYILGRLDQISDTNGDNVRRFVRARDIRSVLDLAGGSRLGLDMGDTEPYLIIFDAVRNTRKAQGEQ